MTESQKLLVAYRTDGSEDAFRELVERYIDLVFSTSLRVVEGDADLAKDVTQTVFLNLARKARTLPDETALGGWLHRDVCFTGSKMMRAERRRKLREQKAAQMNLSDDPEPHQSLIASHLDAAINDLRAKDREVILLRFYEKREFEDIGKALGSSANAVQKRVSRAIERLRVILKRRGISIADAALLTVLSGAVTSAPAALAGTVAVTTFSAASGVSVNFLNILMGNKITTGIVCAVLVANVVTPLVLRSQTRAKTEEQKTILRSQQEQIAALAGQVKGMSKSTMSQNRRVESNDELLRLMKLRGVVSMLRGDVQDLESPARASRDDKLAAMAEQYSARIAQLKGYLQQNPSEQIPELQFLSEEDWLWLAGERTGANDEGFALAMSLARLAAEGNVSRDILRPALLRYSKENAGAFPGEMSDLKPYLDSPLADEILDRWQVVDAKKLKGVAQNLARETLVITQRVPVNPSLDQRIVFSLQDYHMFADAKAEHWAAEP